MRRMYITEKEYAGLKKLLELVDNEVLGYDAKDGVLVINKAVHLEEANPISDGVVLAQGTSIGKTNTVIGEYTEAAE